ncbi:ribosomal protein L28e [Dacryopinax primogenitus]|uniref:Ribosomal protein L28e n=1 Tax=Dacryopinax primogenitus (strain DJM 731) TaxID=1858805 RepID=M5GE00_DACPD|nr:ribosomal protein L28e [Dacryopinax primogenitus]EJU02848.1 ribosomal protein L28e [Dacryopinax primogenitus]
MSADLEWLLIRKWNSFIVKRVPEGPVFSTEAGNLRNLHSGKYSGIANNKVLDIAEEKGQIVIKTRDASAPISANKKAVKTERVRSRSGGRRVAGVVSKKIASGYRPDLRKAALARASALLEAQKSKKEFPAREIRGKKAKSFGLKA